MTTNEVLLQYQHRLTEIEAAVAHARLGTVASALLLALVLALFVTVGIYAIRRQAPAWSPLVPATIALVAARLYARCRKTGTRMWRLQEFYKHSIQRMRGDWAGKGCPGSAFLDDTHPYARDLNVLGEGSLFELLCIARSGVGQHGLAKYLLEAASNQQIEERQQAVRELRSRCDLRESIELLGPFRFSESRWSTFSDWLESPLMTLHPAMRVFILTTTMLLPVLAIASWIGVGPAAAWLPYIIALIAFHAIAGWSMRRRVLDIVDRVAPVSTEIQVILEGLRLLESQQFQSAKLKRLSEQVRGGSQSLKRLGWMLVALNERGKEWFYLPSLVFMVATQVCMAVESWRSKHGSELRGWLSAWAEFETLNSLACHAYENPDHAFPKFSEGAACFEGRDLGHPLLPDESCVRNDFALNGDSRFYVVSGSNMSGKSTLLRAVGLNAVLALAGGAVRARSLTLSQLSVCASITVADSLMSGRSKFLAEVERLRQAIETTAGDRPVLFLIDEIFSGTNSRDRRLAAEAVVKALLDGGAIGALSTHDLALTEIADTQPLRGANVHMGSRDGTDPLDFDYRVKPGVTSETNALRIAKMAGVPGL